MGNDPLASDEEFEDDKTIVDDEKQNSLTLVPTQVILTLDLANMYSA